MIPANLMGALLGIMAATGVMLILVGFTPPPVRTVRGPSRGLPQAELRRVAVTIVVFAVVSVVTNWVALGAAAAVATFYIPAQVEARRAAEREHERVRALAHWIEIIRDSLRSASGIEEAVIDSADLVAHSAIAHDVQRLRLNTETRGIRSALVDFGDAMADPVADHVVWALTIAVDRPSASISEVLSRAAVTARSQVSRRERVQATRARIGTIVNMVFGVTGLLGLFLIGTQASYRSWYSSAAGQAVLIAGLTTQLVMYRMIVRIGKPRATFRTPIPTQIEGQALAEVFR